MISAEFPFSSKYIDIHGSKMHYIDEGKGETVLFLHGNPTSNYLWRNIIPYLSNNARCIAPDLIGMGKSDKPNIPYKFIDQYKYLNAFIEKLELKNVTLIIHDWGSALGFHYAFEHQENIRGIAFMEGIYKTAKWDYLPKAMKKGFKMMRTPFLGWFMVSVGNIFIKKLLPSSIIRKLTKKELDTYAKPYPTISSRKPLRVWPTEIPFDGTPENTHQIVSSYHNWLKQTELPKLLLYAEPGLLIRKKDVLWIKDNFPNTEAVSVGKGLHFIQEDSPDAIGTELAKWYQTI